MATGTAITASAKSETEAPAPPRPRQLIGELLTAFVLTAIVFTALCRYMDNTNINTTNGLWKSMVMRSWVEGAPNLQIDRANVFLFPVNSFFIRLMPESWGPVYRRMALLNGFYGALGVAAVYALLRGLRLGRTAAVCGAIFQAGCAFFLICAIITEDIMPAVAFLTAACAVVAWTWNRQGKWGVFWAAQLFSIAWLFEWRLLVPSLPSFLLAAVFSTDTWSAKVKRCVQFLTASAIIPLITAIVIKLHGANGPIQSIIKSFIFVNKGLGTGYAGWAWNKWGFMYLGIEEYLYCGRNIGNLHSFFSSTPGFIQLIVWSVILGCLAVAGRAVWQRWHLFNWRSTAVVLMTIFGCAEFFNLYSQPQDPQMQMNAMLWLAVAWGIVVYVVVNRAPSYAVPVRVACLALSLCPLVLNFGFWLPHRGDDSAMEKSVASLAEAIPPDHAMLVMSGTEGLTTWIAAIQGWDLYRDPPMVVPKEPWPTWKILCVMSEATVHPNRPPDESAEAVKQQINSALDQDVRVYINKIWALPENDFIRSWSTISGTEKPREVYRMLKREYEAELVFKPQQFFRLRRKAPQLARKSDNSSVPSP